MTVPFFDCDTDRINSIRPYALMDLDDTLFQTRRKLKAWGQEVSPDQLVCATVNKQGEPLSMMTRRQTNFVNWLLASTDLIAVTARDTTEIKRVRLPFVSWQILTHGAVLLQPDGQPHPIWHRTMRQTLAALQDTLRQMIGRIETYNRQHELTLRLAVHQDSFGNGSDTTTTADDSLIIYLGIKHTQRDHTALADFAHRLPQLLTDIDKGQDFYIHVNANNLAILPHAIHKRHAVRFLIDNCLDTQRPCFGFGDSLADLPYLQLLDWYGTPSRGQLHDKVSNLSSDIISDEVASL